MYCLIYRFKVKKGEEDNFIKSWSEVTTAYIDECGGLGSRLHMSAGREYIAYAQWSSRQVRDAAELPESIKKTALSKMRNCCDSIETLYELTPVSDHLLATNK